MIYLAHPYKSDNILEQAMRINASVFMARCFEEGNNTAVVTPVAFGEGQLAECSKLPSEGWYDWCLRWVEASRSVLVLQFPGWQYSTGVSREIAYARTVKIPVDYCSWDRCKEILPYWIWKGLEEFQEQPQ